MSKDVKSSKSRARASALSSGPQTVHRFRLTTYGVMSAGATGQLLNTQTVDPSAFTEFSDLSALFSEIRIVRARVHMCMRRIHSDATSGANVNDYDAGFAVGFDPAITTTAPTSPQNVYAIAGAKLIPSNMVATQTFEAKIPQMAWAAITSPVPGPYAGCYGAFQMASANGAYGANATVATIATEVEVEVRGRR